LVNEDHALGSGFYDLKYTIETLGMLTSDEAHLTRWDITHNRANNRHLVVGVYYYRPPNQEQLDDEALLLQLQEASRLQALSLMGDFNHTNVCWESNNAGCKQSRRLLECIDNCLVQVLDKPIRGEVLLDLMLTNADELIKEVKTGGSLGCSNGALVEFMISRTMGLAKRKVRTLKF
ncbi:hypothetical protein HGM15179_019976, partial [Zosterops borbonicus]